MSKALLPTIFLATISISLTACNTGKVKHTNDNVMDVEILNPAIHHYEKGKRALNHFHDSGDTRSLVDARIHLEKAYRIRPSDINIQDAYVNYKYSTAYLVDADKIEEQLLKVYNALHPYVRNQYAPPATLSYFKAKKNGADREQQYLLLDRALSQNPSNPNAWLNISDFFLSIGFLWQALSTAHIAYSLKPDEASYANKVGIAYSIMAFSKACVADHSNYLKKSAEYYLRASKLAPENGDYLANLSRRYLSLGLLPLAYSQAKKAFDLNPSPRISAIYAHTAILQGKWQEAEGAITKVHSSLASPQEANQWALHQAAHVSQALIKYGHDTEIPQTLSQHEAAKDFLSLFRKIIQPRGYNTAPSEFDGNETLAEIAIYLDQDVVSMKEEDIETGFIDRCKRSSWYFALATKAATNGEDQKKQYFLDKVVQERNFSSHEYFWAKVLRDKKGER